MSYYIGDTMSSPYAPPPYVPSLGDKLRGHGIDYLTDNGVDCLRCFRGGCFHIRVGYPKTSRKATLNRILQVTNGMLVVQKNG